MSPDFKDALVFTGGGTGGHYYPAVALAEGARERWPGLPIAFVGDQRGIEAKKLPGSGWAYCLLDVEGFLGRSPIKAAKSAWKLWVARAELMEHWRRERPRAVVATGGYGSAPSLLAARALQIPYFIHESNAIAGMLVKRTATGARRVWCGMEALRAELGGCSCLLVGTPLRQVFLRPFTPVEALTGPRRILVLGGSGGAVALNDAVLDAAPALLERFPDWEIVHQTGRADFERLESLDRSPRHHLVRFIEQVDQVMESASLVISRSGASTCAELKACGRGAILVPMPRSARDHQTMNAQAMADEGRAILLPQTPALPTVIREKLAAFMESPVLCGALSKPEANRAVEFCLDDLALLCPGLCP
jgi:UDP-N-acetylglucosamine--N-acetylmuramyl-(pentapeptide) pyrophosphoryl-undecaprenol N-acetylglucosamine transferase